MLVVHLIFFFVMAYLGEHWVIQWHEAREKKELKRFSLLTAVLKVLEYVPIWVAFKLDAVSVLIVSVIGAVVGGLHALTKGDKDEIREQTDGD